MPLATDGGGVRQEGTLGLLLPVGAQTEAPKGRRAGEAAAELRIAGRGGARGYGALAGGGSDVSPGSRWRPSERGCALLWGARREGG